MPSRKILCATLAALLAALSAPARADFNADGTETFDGTALDLNHWQIYSWKGGTPMTQNNALTITCLDPVQGGYTNYADYTTLQKTVAVGQGVSVDVTLNQYTADVGWGAMVAVYLTTNSAGTTHNTAWDDYKLDIRSDAGWNIFQAEYGHSGAGFGSSLVPGGTQPAGTTYRYNIQRLTSSSAYFTVYDASNHLLGSKTVTLLGISGNPISPYSDPLYISLYGQGVSVTFDNLTVSDNIPEPASLALLAPALLLLKRRRK